jgi:3-carboxy-cis,cis-muconate cycloisomerase
LLGKANAKRLLAVATSAAELDGTDLADLLAVALDEAGVVGPDLSGLFDPSGYTGMSGPLVDRALERFENFGKRDTSGHEAQQP